MEPTRVRAKSADGEVRFLGDDCSPLDAMVDASDIGLRIHVSARGTDTEALKARLDRARSSAGPDSAKAGRGGEVAFIASLDGRHEVELKLPGRYRLDGALKAALKSAPGVLMLEDA